jgi:hypothetical protein
MELAIENFVIGIREAFTIWLGLIALALAAFGFLYLADRTGRAERRRARSESGRVRRGLRHRRRTPTHDVEVAGSKVTNRRATPLLDEADDLRRYADEIAVAARRAAVTAERHRAEELAARRTQEAAWRAYDAAEIAARRVFRAAAYPAPHTPLTERELAHRKQYLHTAATQAYERGELSAEQLKDVLAHRNGWDPRRHPFDQEVTLRRVGLQHLFHAYRVAAELAEAAERATDIAAAAERCLAEEALTAAINARQAQLRVAGQNGGRHRPVHAVRGPSFAT